MASLPYSVLNGINFGLALLAVFLLFLVLHRTKGRLHRGSSYILLGIAALGITDLLQLATYSSSWPGEVAVEVLELAAMLLLIAGLWQLQRCIQEVHEARNHRKSR